MTNQKDDPTPYRNSAKESPLKPKSPQPQTKSSESKSKSSESQAKSDTTPTIKTNKRAGKYVIVGICITIFNYGLYAILANLIIRNNDLLWLSTFISTVITTIVAYIAHSKITWKERHITKHSIIRFFIWNAILAIAVGPWLTQLFSLFTPLYELAYNICTTIHLPFTYEFVLTTGAFAFTSLVVMILNFIFYDHFVFGEPKM